MQKYKLARIADRNGDLSKKWYVSFYVWDDEANGLIRHRDYSINTHKTKKERRAAAVELRDNINEILKNGTYSTKTAEDVKVSFQVKTATIIEAIKNAYNIKGAALSADSRQSVDVAVNHLEKFLANNGLSALLMVDMKLVHAEMFRDYLRDEIGLASKTINNYKAFVSSLINVYVKRELLNYNPFNNLPNLKTQKGNVIHLPYSNEQMKAIREHINKKGSRQSINFISFIYYCFIRPKELRLLTVNCIREKTIYISGEISKNKKGAHVVVPFALEKIIIENNLRSYPGHYYIFSKDGVPGPTATAKRHFWVKNCKILKDLKYDKLGHDLYSYKHTGVINLYNACKDIKAIQRQCRHSTIQQTDTYLRDLGCITNEQALNFPEF